MPNLFLTAWYALTDEVKALIYDVRQPENGEAVDVAAGITLSFGVAYLLVMWPYFA